MILRDQKRVGKSIVRTQETIPREEEMTVYNPSPSVPLTDKSVIFRQHQGDKNWVKSINSQLGLTTRYSKIKQGGSMAKRSTRHNSFTDRREDPTVASEQGYMS
mmetsp:Transcript_31961/g.48927  ORF Transcript_31961/g.48927 Transcript_31961/m.48927 type:complete len:104 (+) Transcript_31961:232-543(+)